MSKYFVLSPRIKRSSLDGLGLEIWTDLSEGFLRLLLDLDDASGDPGYQSGYLVLQQ